MTSLILAKLRAILLIAVGALFLPNSVNATEPVIDKRLDELIKGCVNFVIADPKNSKDGADACEKVTNTIKVRTEMHQKAIAAEHSLKERERWAFFGWSGLIVFDLLLMALVVAILIVTKGKSSTLLNDPDGKVSFSRVIGLFGATSIFIASALLLNVLLAHLYVFNTAPDGIVSLFAPVLTFVPTLFPYVFAKREEGSVARTRALAETSR